MSSNILFIVEGAKVEKNITQNLTQFFVNENTVITCAYCTTIYKMYKEIESDEDLDIFNLLKDIDANKEILKHFKRSDFAEIYLFFDYDGHATNANDQKMEDLLTFFKEETDKGKLYISYPMVEALKHIEDFDTFRGLKVGSKIEKYKQIVNQQCDRALIDLNQFNFDTWRKVIEVHLKKSNFIVDDVFEFPTELIAQSTIFSKQLEKYIKVDKTVAVLSAFPLFLHDYYGNDGLKHRINRQQFPI